MEHIRYGTSQMVWAYARKLPPVRGARRPRHSVFRVPMNFDAETRSYDYDGIDSMDRFDKKTEYGDHMSVDDILSEFQLGDEFSDFDKSESHLFTAPADASVPRPTLSDPIDARFNLGGKPKKQGYVPSTAIDLDLSEDEDYIHIPQEDLISAVDEDELDFDSDYSFEDSTETKRKSLFGFIRRKKDHSSRTQPKYVVEKLDEEKLYEDSFREFSGDPGEYAQVDYEDRDDYGYDDPESSDLESGYSLPSFGEYIASLFASAFLRIRGTHRSTTAETMEDVDEDLGKELDCLKASKYYGAHVHSAKMRLLLGTIMQLLMLYVSLGLPVPGMLGYLPVAAAMCMACQFMLMLLGLDVVTTAILNGVRLRIGADTLAVLSCIITSIDAAFVATGNATHMPLCAVSSLSLFGVMYASLCSTRALRKSLRVPAIARHIYSITGENDVKGTDITILKTSRPVTGFVHRAEEAAPDETLFIKLAPFFLAAALLMSTVVALVTKNAQEFLFIFSSILCPAVPFTALLCFAFPFYRGACKIFHSGAAIAGWSGLCDIGQSNNMVVTDRDLFPAGTVSIESIRIFADEDAQKVISYAGTMMVAAGCSASQAFADEMEQNGCVPCAMESFETLSGGGLKAIIDGHVVLCGSNDLMSLMKVRFPFRLVEGTSVLLAIDGILYGIFGMKYEPLPLVRKALVDLMRSNRHPIFALRDFNITPQMLSQAFDLVTEGYDFPPYVERFRITETQPSASSKIAAVVCLDGLAPITNMADTGRSMFMAIRLNLTLCVLSAVLGMLVVFFKILTTGSIAPAFILTYMLLTALPVYFVSVFMK